MTNGKKSLVLGGPVKRGQLINDCGKVVQGQNPDPPTTEMDTDFTPPEATGPKVPEDNQPLSGSIFFPTGAGVHDVVQRGGQPKLVGFTFTLEEFKQPITFVFSKNDAKQMKEMLDKVLG